MNIGYWLKTKRLNRRQFLFFSVINMAVLFIVGAAVFMVMPPAVSWYIVFTLVIIVLVIRGILAQLRINDISPSLLESMQKAGVRVMLQDSILWMMPSRDSSEQGNFTEQFLAKTTTEQRRIIFKNAAFYLIAILLPLLVMLGLVSSGFLSIK